jgi:hypothetical protein
MTDQQVLSLNTDLAVKAIEANLRANLVSFLWGKPGIGKTAIVRKVAKRMKLPVIEVRAAERDPVDLRGIPFVRDGRTHWALPNEFPTDGAGILFFDEFCQAPQSVQNVFSRLLDRAEDGYRLPDGYRMIGASNRMEDRAGTTQMPTQLRNRLIHLHVEADLGTWETWAIGADIRPEIIAFHRLRCATGNQLLQAFDRNAFSFPTCRSWAYVSQQMDAQPDPEVEMSVYAGAVGFAAATEFTGFLRIWREMPDIGGILLSPMTARVPASPSALYAVATALATRASDTTIGPIIQYLDRIEQQEFAVVCIKDAKLRTPAITTTKPYIAWAVKHQEVLL